MKTEDMERLRKKVLSRMSTGDVVDDAATAAVIDECLEAEEIKYGLRERLAIRKELFNAIRRYDVLSELLDDPEVTEIMVNGPDNIFYERDGHLFRYDKAFRDTDSLENLVRQIAAGVNRQINEASPIVDARLLDGSRVHCILNPVALDGPIMSIRKFTQRKYTMKGLIEQNSISAEAAEYLKTLVGASYNIFICGGTGSGKTTLLNSLSEYIDSCERVITIEDSAELQILGCPNLVRLETRNASREGTKQISIRDLIKSALRLRPDRLIVGEVRGEEAVDMLQAMNTGHSSMSTGHANSTQDMLRRLETMVLMGMEIPLQAVRGQISSAIDILVQVARLRDGSRRVVSIDEVLPMVDGEIILNPLFTFREKGGDEHERVYGDLEKKGRLIRREKLQRAGKDLDTEEENNKLSYGGDD